MMRSHKSWTYLAASLAVVSSCAGGVESTGGLAGHGGGPAGNGGGAGSSGGKGGPDGASAGGNGGTSQDDAGPVLVQPGRVVISEIMYHPAGEDSAGDNHEFIELHNRGDKAVDLAKWRLDGVIQYEFPAGSSLSPRQYVVIAKNKDALLALAAYALAPASVLGSYSGELDNGGGRIGLVDVGGTLVDTVTYKDSFPWPIAADALGASEKWLPASLLPIGKHRYMGVSLERVSFDVPANEVSNWAPSPVDGATPGKANVATGAPLAVVETLSVGPLGQAGPLIRSADKVTIAASFSRGLSVSDVQLEYFVDDPQKMGEPVSAAPMAVADGGYSVVLDPRADNSIVRYRIVGNRGAGKEIISPRPSDPFGWHAYFVSPALKTNATVYQIFISGANWGRMWTNIQAGPVTPLPPPAPFPAAGCNINPGWEAKVPAVFVHEGQVFDVMVRYQGSRWNRVKGPTIASWPYPGPSAGPKPLLSLSWAIDFPKYKRFEGAGKINLNKMYQACPGVDELFQSRILASVGVPVQKISFARLHVNGGYYNYVMRMEGMNDDMAQRIEGKSKPIGDMFKANGTGIDEGPIAEVSNGSLLKVRCPNFTLEQKYQGTYPRTAPGWKGEKNDELVKMLTDHVAARAAGRDAVRAYLTANFDVPLMITQYATRNWFGVWDDTAHNYMPYRHPGGQWILLPQDLDQNFGGCACNIGPKVIPTTSFYEGEEGDIQLPPDPPPPPPQKAPVPVFHFFKDSIQKNFRDEFDQRLRELGKTTLKPESALKVLEEAAAEFSIADWNQAPAKSCNVPARIQQVREWITARHAVLVQRLGQ